MPGESPDNQVTGAQNRFTFICGGAIFSMYDSDKLGVHEQGVALRADLCLLVSGLLLGSPEFNHCLGYTRKCQLPSTPQTAFRDTCLRIFRF
jgi:hypothetical protein